MFAPKNILVPTDFSVYADNALKQAIDIAKQNKSKIYLFHVIDDGFQQCAVDYCLNEGDVQRIYKDSIKNAMDKLQQEAKGIDLIVIASKCFDPMKNVMVSVECSCMY